MSRKSPHEARIARHYRVRRKVSGTAQRPRLSVFRSLNRVYVQVIDDQKGVTLAAASSTDEAVKSVAKGKTKTDEARAVGATIAKLAKERGVTEVVFDRGGYLYHGRVKAVAEAAREGGLKF
jgi:large subunit ribosomal protein L18